MILPELTLPAGGERGKRRRLRLIMHGQWKILEYDFYRLFIPLEHLLEKWHDLATVGSLKVGEHGDLDRGVGPSLRGAAGIVYADDVVYG